MKPIELEDRLIQFAIDTIIFCKTIEKSFAGDYLSKQLIRSASASPLNYGEARSAESTRDFLHKMKICLKELRECLRNLNIQIKADLISEENISDLIDENDQLIRIIVTRIKNIK